MKIKQRIFHSYVMVFLLLLNGALMWKCFIIIPDYVSKGLLLFWALIGCFENNKFILEKRWLKIMCLILAYLVVYIWGTRYDIFGSVLNLLISSGVLGTYCYTLIKCKQLVFLREAFINVMCCIACVSLVFWLLGSVLNILPGYSILTYFWGNEYNTTKTFFFLYFENFAQNQNLFGLSIPRNCGIFPEAPGYSGMLLYALAAEWFSKVKIDKKKWLILLCTLLSTQSTKALIVLIIVAIIKFMIDNKGVKSKVILLLKFFFSFVLIAFGFLAIWFILEDKSSTASYIVRLDDINASLETWKDNILFGSGYQNDLAIIKNVTTTNLRKSDALSMGLGVLLAEGGIYLTLFYFGSFFMALRSKLLSGYKIQFLLFSLVIILNLFVSNVVFSMMTILLVNCGYAVSAYRPQE